jgi:hypothetical protein
MNIISLATDVSTWTYVNYAKFAEIHQLSLYYDSVLRPRDET